MSSSVNHSNNSKEIIPIWLDQVPSFNSVMLWTAALVTCFSFCRFGDVTVEDESKHDAKTHLSWADVAVDNVESLSLIPLNIKYSKMDTKAE